MNVFTDRFKPGKFQSTLVSQLLTLLMLAVLLGWLKTGYARNLDTRLAASLYWAGALLITWSLFLATSITFAAAFRSLRIPNLVFILIGCVIPPLCMQSVLYWYISFYGTPVSPTPIWVSGDVWQIIQSAASHLYANTMFIVLWFWLNYLAWCVAVEQPLADRKTMYWFLRKPGYWLLDTKITAPQTEFLNDPEVLSGPLLSANVKRADVIALKAEDHYVQVITESGHELIHARLADAIQDIEGAVEGFRVHRSWWVRADKIAASSPGRLSWVEMGNKLRIPVSRSYALGVQEALGSKRLANKTS